MRRPWEKHKAEMIRLYLSEGKKLDDVMEVMLQQFGFKASKRAYRFHFDHWGIEKYNCKKRNQRKLSRQHHHHQLPSPPVTTSPTHSIALPALGIKEERSGLDLVHGGGEYFQDTFAARSLSRNTELAYSSTSLPYPGNLALSPGQALAPPPTNMLLRATPSPEPDSSANNNNNHLSFEPSLNLLGPTSFLRTSIESLLHQAIRRRNLPQVRTCLDQGAGVDMPDASGSFPIHAAVGSGDPAIVRMVLQAGGNPNQPDRQGQSPLYQATTLPVLDVLLASNTPLDLCQKDFTGGTIMHHHVRNPWWCSDLFKREAVYRLLEQGSYGAAPVNTADAQGMTPFHEALTQVEANLPAMVLPLTRMLDRHADVASPFPAARFEDPTMPLEVFVLGMQTHLQMSRNAQNALDDRQWDSLHALLLRFLDLSARTVYSARLLRVFLCPTLLSISVCRLWNFLQRLVKGVADKSAADEQGRTALHDVLLGASAFAQGAGHTLGEERVTCLLKMLVREMDGETLRAGGERGQAAWQIYVRRWSGHRYFGEMMRLFADHGAGVPGQLQPQLPAAGMAPKETSWDPFLEGQAMRWAAGDHGGMETGFGWARDAGHLGRGIAVKREV